MDSDTRSRFFKVKCNDCGNEQVIFGNSSNPVKCLVCDKKLATPSGGKANITAEVIETVDSDLDA